MQPCKHGHIDGALHKPCYQCAYEAAQAEIESLREEVKAFRGDSLKLTDQCLKERQRADELRQEIESLRETVGSLTVQLDKQFGTPCEQVRHAEEIESLRIFLHEEEKKSIERGKEIESLREAFERERGIRFALEVQVDALEQERDELREQIKEQNQAYSDLSQLCNLKIADETAQRKRADEIQRRLDLMFQWIEQDWYEFVSAHPEAAQWFSKEGR